jgi:hypothetical protein
MLDFYVLSRNGIKTIGIDIENSGDALIEQEDSVLPVDVWC